MSMLNCFRMTKSIIQYEDDLKNQIIMWKILLNFTYESVVEPLHKYFAVNTSLFVFTPKDWKVIFIFAFRTRGFMYLYMSIGFSIKSPAALQQNRRVMRALAALNSGAAVSVLCIMCELASVCRRALSHQH
jgi:hypothetical protein